MVIGDIYTNLGIVVGPHFVEFMEDTSVNWVLKPTLFSAGTTSGVSLRLGLCGL